MTNYKILIFGLPGSGKTTLAKHLSKSLNAKWFNADQVRKKFKNWDFSKKGILKQARRMKKISQMEKKISVIDFVCPYDKGRKIFNADYLIWMNTIKKGRLSTFDKIFQKPKKVDYEVKFKNVNFHSSKIINDLKYRIFNRQDFNNKKKNSAVILCGGKGTRLGQLGKKIPKSLVKIHGYPIIWYIINILKRNSFNHFILPVGYKGNLIKKYFKKNSIFKKYNIEIIKTGQETSIAERIYRIREKIRSKNFILLNGDAIFDFDLKKILNNHEKKKFDITFMGCSAQLNFGIVEKLDNKIVGFERDVEFNSIKKKDKKNFIGYVYSGITILNSKLLKINFKKFSNFEKKFYPKIIKNYKSNFEQINGFWHSIDNIKDINNLNEKRNKIKYNRVKKIIKKIKYK